MLSLQKNKTYGENYAAVTEDWFWKWADNVLQRATDLNEVHYPV